MTGMEHAIEHATRVIGDLPGFNDAQVRGIAEDLAEAGLLAPAPLREVRAENQFGETHARWATEWELVGRAEGDLMNRQNTVVLVSETWLPEPPRDHIIVTYSGYVFMWSDELDNWLEVDTEHGTAESWEDICRYNSRLTVYKPIKEI